MIDYDYHYIKPADLKYHTAGKKRKSQKRTGRFSRRGNSDVSGSAEGKDCKNICFGKLL